MYILRSGRTKDKRENIVIRLYIIHARKIFQGQQMTKINISNGVNILKNNDTTRQQPHNFNPNRKIKAMKNAYGSSYDYTFLDLDEQQRQFYFFMQRREKRHK